MRTFWYIRSMLLGLLSLTTCVIGCDESSSGDDFDVKIQASYRSGSAPFKASFTSRNNGPIDGSYRWSWDFGDGETSDEQNPKHVYDTPGEYTVTLTVSENNNGQKGSDTLSINVSESVELSVRDFIFSPSTPAQPSDTLSVTWTASQDRSDGVNPWRFLIFAVPSSTGFQGIGDSELIELATLEESEGGESGNRSLSLEVVLPSDIPSNDYLIGVFADDQEVVGEEDESDNLALGSAPLRIRNQAEFGPDVTICDFKVKSFRDVEPGQRPSIPQGEQLTLQLCLANIGDRPLTNNQYAIYLSEDQRIDDSDQLLVESGERPLAPGDRVELEVLIDLSLEQAPGVYRLIVVADPQDEELEKQEDNNSRFNPTPFEIVPPGMVSGVDLVLGGLDFNTQRVFWGQRFVGNLTLINRGDQAVERLFVIRINAIPTEGGAPVQISSLNLMGIEANETLDLPFDIAITQRVPEGQYRIQVEVDPTNGTGDVNPGNNRRTSSESLTLGGEPQFDPSIRSITPEQTEVVAGNTLAVTLDLENLGTDPTGPFSIAMIFSDDQRLGAEDILLMVQEFEGLASEESRSLNIDVLIPITLDQRIATWHIAAVIDPEDLLVGELSEENNALLSDEEIVVTGAQGGCGEDRFEENDAAGQATSLSQGIYENLGICDEADWFATTVEPSEILEIKMEWPVNEGTPSLNLASRSGAILFKAEQKGEAQYTFALALNDEQTRYLYLMNGEGAELSYTLDVQLTPRPQEGQLRFRELSVSPGVTASGAQVELSYTLINTGLSETLSQPLTFKLTERADPSAESIVDLSANMSLMTPTLSAGASVDQQALLTLPENIPNGLYYLIIETGDVSHSIDDAGWGAAPLRVDPTMACGTDEFEPNGSPYEEEGLNDRAAELIAGTYDNLVACVGDDDWYRLVLEEGEALDVYAGFNGREGDIDLALYEADGETLIAVSDSFQNSEQVQVYRSPARREYLLRVYLNPNDELNVSTTYQLQIGIGPSETCGDDGYEPNGAPDQAAVIDDGLHELLVCPGGEDWFRFNIPAGNTVSYFLVTGINDVELALFDPDDQLIEVSERRIVHVAEYTGTYRLRIRPTSQDQPAPYTLEISGVSGVDLVLSQLFLSSESFSAGDQILARVDLQNQLGDTAEDIVVRFSLSSDIRPDRDDVVVGEYTLAQIEGAGTASIRQRLSIPTDTLTGDLYLIAEIDPTRSLPDIRPGNNVKLLPVSVANTCLDDDPRDNEGPTTATPLSWDNTPASRAGVICSGTEDWYKIDAPSGDLSFILTITGGDLDLSIYGPTDQLIAESSTESATEQINLTLDEATELRIRVDGFLDARGLYELNWSTR